MASANDGVFYHGFGMKRGGFRKNWKLRWFEVSNTTLCYFQCEASKEATLKGTIQISDIRHVSIGTPPGCSISWPMSQYPPAKEDGCRLLVRTTKREYFFVFPTAEDTKQWFNEIDQSRTQSRTRRAPSVYDRRVSMQSCQDQFNVMRVLEDDEDIRISDDES
eukprot:m.32589 g.32589  ORF g.32589 m.32589 type:complete len:163 (-) comp9529_c0_seq2:361-849(-)